MNKEITQICQEISPQDILNKKFYPVWFFTNEKTGEFLLKFAGQNEIRNIFSIGGGGDFAFNCLSAFDNIAEINVCDIRQLANITIDFKIGLIKKLSSEEMFNLFQDFKSANKDSIYKKVREEITPLSRLILNSIVNDCRQSNFLKCLKKSGYWYKDSFWQIRNKKIYLPYLVQDKYQLLQERMDKINIYYDDFNNNLKLFDDNFYDLIYVSNLFDSKKYCAQIDSSLRIIKEKLNKNGSLLLVTQNRAKKIIKTIQRYGFQIYKKELHKFNIITSLLGHCCYSFLLFKKIS